MSGSRDSAQRHFRMTDAGSRTKVSFCTMAPRGTSHSDGISPYGHASRVDATGLQSACHHSVATLDRVLELRYVGTAWLFVPMELS